jgi:hypothetical protein
MIYPTVARLELPDDPVRQAQLRKKLDEYLFRLRLPLYDRAANTLKIAILQRLFSAGSINPVAFAAELATDPTQRFDPALFYDAFTVIGNYCRNGGAGTVGGTGLPAVR